METLPNELIEMLGWYPWRQCGDIRSVIKFALTTKITYNAIIGASEAPILRHMAAFKCGPMRDINDIIYITTESIKQYSGGSAIISATIRRYAVIYVRTTTVNVNNTEDIVLYNVSLGKPSAVISTYDKKDGYIYKYVESPHDINSSKINEICNLFIGFNNHIISCNCNTKNCDTCTPSRRFRNVKLIYR
jgi:hypothetical protein